VPLDGSEPAQVLYSEPALPSSRPLSFIGVSGNTLVFAHQPDVDPGNIETLPVGAAGGLTTIASVSGVFRAIVGTNIYINSGTPAPDQAYEFENSTQIIGLDGTVVQPLMAQSTFVSDLWGPPPLLQERDISDPSGLGGGSLYVLDPSSPGAPSPAQITAPGGGPFRLPPKTVMAWLAPIGPNISVGLSAGNGTPPVTLIYDGVNKQIASFSMPQTDVSGVTPGN